MKKFTKLTALVLALVFVMAAFAGCGNKDNGSDTANKAKVEVIKINLTEEEYAFGVSKKDPELLKTVNKLLAEMKEDGTIDAIMQKYFGDAKKTPIVSAKEDSTKDQLIVATEAGFPPFEYKQGEGFLGIDMEIAKILAEKLGKELVIKNVSFDAVLTQVESGYADIAMAGLTVNEKRMKQVNFSDTYYEASQNIIVKAGDTTFAGCKTKEDVEKVLNSFDSKVKMGAQRGTTGQYYIEGDESYGFAGLKATFVGYDNGALAVQDMLNGNLDYVVIDKVPAASISKSVNGK